MAYLGEKTGTKGFDVCITYEMILDWFTSQSPAGLRMKYKQYVIKDRNGTMGMIRSPSL